LRIASWNFACLAVVLGRDRTGMAVPVVRVAIVRAGDRQHERRR
jgi:hypothetical protein